MPQSRAARLRSSDCRRSPSRPTRVPRRISSCVFPACTAGDGARLGLVARVVVARRAMLFEERCSVRRSLRRRARRGEVSVRAEARKRGRSDSFSSANCISVLNLGASRLQNRTGGSASSGRRPNLSLKATALHATLRSWRSNNKAERQKKAARKIAEILYDSSKHLSEEEQAKKFKVFSKIVSGPSPRKKHPKLSSTSRSPQLSRRASRSR